jgi:hypothetical protein
MTDGPHDRDAFEFEGNIVNGMSQELFSCVGIAHAVMRHFMFCRHSCSAATRYVVAAGIALSVIAFCQLGNNHRL